jgi:glycosyltransferase involved in cell wall biosynthesis
LPATDARVHVSVVISTFNGRERLSRTLAAVLSQDTIDTQYEVIGVDNNSTDETSDTIATAARSSRIPLTHLFESRQGVSYGRNAGIQAARAPIIAFTDDDVIVARDWIANIHRVMLGNPGVDYVTGKILPVYERQPPRWMALVNSGPCVLRDRGNWPLYARPGYFFPGWATANIAFRREVFDRIGLFAGDFPRGQDLELIVRLWRANGRGMYAPDVVVSHLIGAARRTKAYHRMWHTREGDIRARVRFREIFDRDDHVLSEAAECTRLLGVPVFPVRQLAIEAAAWNWAGISHEAHPV